MLPKVVPTLHPINHLSRWLCMEVQQKIDSRNGPTYGIARALVVETFFRLYMNAIYKASERALSMAQTALKKEISTNMERAEKEVVADLFEVSSLLNLLFLLINRW